ncbi:MAG: GNAT family N-acetyltransferase [Promethearchaeota archaeon]
MSDQNTIATIEQTAARAWPAQHTSQYGGWLLRATEGVTRRANSVLPLGTPGDQHLDIALENVQNFYQQHNLPPRFQMTAASQPSELDTFLESAGFNIDMRVKVLTVPVASILLVEPEVGIVVFGSPWNDWFNAYQKAAGFDKKQMRVRQGIIERVPTEKAFAAAIMDEHVVGVGLGVLEDQWLGLFSLVTESNYRRQHVASSITQSLIGWGLSRGAEQSYLQVETENEPALKLYLGLGFVEAYSYWYRVSP